MSPDQYTSLIALAFIILDVVAGVAAAAINHELDSEVARKGLYRKFALVLILVVAGLIDWIQPKIPMGFEVPVFVPTVVYIVLMEINSIFESVMKIDPKLVDSGVFKIFAHPEIKHINVDAAIAENHKLLGIDD